MVANSRTLLSDHVSFKVLILSIKYDFITSHYFSTVCVRAVSLVSYIDVVNELTGAEADICQIKP